MTKVIARFALLALMPVLCPAVSTRTWLSSSYADLDKGERKGVSLRSDGRVTLAPESEELFDSTLAYLWALARDSKGVLYAGGGPGARVYRYKPGAAGAKPEKIAEFDAVEVHALAIDSQDRVYAATFPDGKIYRLNPAGKPEEFYDPKQKYIWSMLFDTSGSLLVATGDKGEIHRVTPDGKGTVFFRSEDTHVRSLAFSGRDLIAGTDPTGLVIRINPKGEGFVLYQLPKREVTAVAVAPDGSIYAAGAGTQQAAGGPSALLAAVTGANAARERIAAAAAGAAPAEAAAAGDVAAAATAPRRAPAITGGSEVFRIDSSGLPAKVWEHPRDVVYAIAFDKAGNPFLGSGDKGTLYRIDTPSLYTAVEAVNANQITTLLTAPDGSVLASTGNIGKVFRFGPGLAREGTITSEVFDSGSFSMWGKLTPYGDGLKNIKLESHSGNLDRPRYYWSNWTTDAAPAPSRFIQWRATLNLTATPAATPPVLDSVEQAYLPRNVAPRVEEIESTPPNYKFPVPVAAILLQRTPATITLPAMGRRSSTTSFNPEGDASSTLSLAKGWLGLRWTASDENGDALLYTLEIRGENEAKWKPLKDKLTDRHYSFDSTEYPDGEYRIRVTATDQPGNPAGEALSGQLVSNPILIDNTPPLISGLAAKPSPSGLHVTWKATDALNVIKRAEYALDGEDWMLAEPVARITDAESLDYALDLNSVASGEHVIAIRMTDDYENSSVQKILVSK